MAMMRWVENFDLRVEWDDDGKVSVRSNFGEERMPPFVMFHVVMWLLPKALTGFQEQSFNVWNSMREGEKK